MPRTEHIVFLPFRLDLVNEQLWQENHLLPLPPKPFAILRYLVEHAGRLVTKEELLKAVWPSIRVSEVGLKSYIYVLRTALGDTSQIPQFIETVPRRGYRFIGAVQPVASAVQSQQGPSVVSSVSSLFPVWSIVGREAELG